ncbi:hypothetical protein [Naumannella halotolerans]|uniref:Anti-sigma factor RsiW n=1 Tax=Naumannella halotolerans TaxID=993414 RepID=A0A4R7J5Q6_9ACTN|nr:hypothetical protein [Naumannella halotolerans]TDT32680.1 anti-sigma factor RsiW [Naumannella halotolerans]
MARRPTDCFTCAELSAFVDTALSAAEQEQVAGHLVGCRTCAVEVASMRELRTLLRGSSSPVSAPGALPDRLRAIAGPGADEPLWARPFDRPAESAGYAALPSSRRSHLHRRVITTTCLFTLLAGVVLVGWVAAPANRQVVVDPTVDARTGFATALAQMPLANVAVGAVAADPSVPQQAGPASAGGPSAEEVALSELGSDCLRFLQEAQAATADLAVNGVQTVEHRDGTGWRSGTVEVANLPGFGTALDLGGSAGFTPSTEQPLLELASFGSYELGCTANAGRVAGRSASVVEATSESGTTTRWWLDSETGYPLWTDRFTDGQLVSRAGFSSVAIGKAIEISDAASPTQDLGEAGEVPSLGELPLLTVSGDGDGTIESVYGDGMITLLVSQQVGTLVPGDSMAFDAERGVHQAVDGAVTVYAWQSGDQVWTVVTDGSTELADEVSGALPHEEPTEANVVDRVVSGLVWIGARFGIR